MSDKLMSWAEVKMAKHFAEEIIRTTIQELHDNTGLLAKDINIRIDDTATVGGDIGLRYEVELDLRVK